MKQKLKKIFRSFVEICEETARLINGKYREMTNKMWEIGKIITKKRKEIYPKYGEQFLAGIAERMESHPTPRHLAECERFYNRYPDLQTRVIQSGLSPSHYQRLSRLYDEKKRNFLEKIAIKKNLSVRELEEKIYPEKEYVQPDGIADYLDQVPIRFRSFKDWKIAIKEEPELTKGVVYRIKRTIKFLQKLVEESGSETIKR